MGVNTGEKHRELNEIKRLDFWFKSVVSHFRYIVSFNAKNNKTAPSIYCCMQSDWGATFLLPRDNFEHYAGRQDLQMNVHMIFWYRNQFQLFNTDFIHHRLQFSIGSRIVTQQNVAKMRIALYNMDITYLKGGLDIWSIF